MAVSEEEALLVCHELRKRGYAFTYVYGEGRAGYVVRARRYPPLSDRGRNESVIEITEIAGAFPYLAGVGVGAV
jgi:hypothetical protein